MTIQISIYSGCCRGGEILRGKVQIQPRFEENIACHFKTQFEGLSVVDDVATARTTTWHDFTREIGTAPVEAPRICVIKDSKIATEAWYVSEVSLAKLKSALAEMIPAELKVEAPAESF